jgi:ATP-dependent DNA helicase RecQ
VLAYTGQDDHSERAAAEESLLANEIKALVATSALGMGFDKPDLGFIVHLGAPASPIAYYQQIGRAGRATDRADVVLLPGREDRDIWAYFASLAFPPETVVRSTLAALAESGRALSTAALETRVDLSRGRLEMMLKVLDTDGAVRRVSGGWTATGVPWAYDGDRYARVAAERSREQQAMLDYAATGGCRMEYLRRELDDPEAEPCGRCDNCTGQRWPSEVSAEAAAQAGGRLLRPGVEITPRRMWPTGMAGLGIDVSGKIGPGVSAGPGRALGRLTDLGWGPRLRALLAAPDEASGPGEPGRPGRPDGPGGAGRPGGPDGPGGAGRPGGPDMANGRGGDDGDVPDDLVAAVVKVLAAWDWAQRPVGVVAVPSRSRPLLVRGLAARIAEIGRLPHLGDLGYRPGSSPDPPRVRQYNSAQRLCAVWHELVVPEPLAAAVAGLGGPVLLVDDLVESGWTITVAAKLLREAGAPAVLPLTLAVTTA